MVEFASHEHMQVRTRLAEEFFRSILGPDGEDYADYRLAFVSDEATLRDIAPNDEAEVIQRVGVKYGVEITVDFWVPFWQLLDRLEAGTR